MCFYITKKNPDSLIAAEDIVSYKIVNTNLTSQYNDFQYEIGKIYSLNGNLKPSIEYISFLFPRKFSHRKFSHLLVDKIINEGFHSYVNKNEISHFKNNHPPQLKTLLILECVIPKESTYYINDVQYTPHQVDMAQYVSNKLKPIRLVNIINDNDYNGQELNQITPSIIVNFMTK